MTLPTREVCPLHLIFIFIFMQLIIDGNGEAVWGSGTHGDRGADKLLFGIGTEAEPYLELARADGERLWST